MASVGRLAKVLLSKPSVVTCAVFWKIPDAVPSVSFIRASDKRYSLSVTRCLAHTHAVARSSR